MRLFEFLKYMSIAIASLALINPAQATVCERPDRLKFSLVPQGDFKSDIAQLQPLFDNLQHALDMPVTIVIPSSYGSVIEGLLSGAIDLARLGPAAYVSAKKEEPSLVAFASYFRKKDIFNQASASYYSLLIARADASYKSVRSLQGKAVALVDPESTSGALIARHIVARETGKPIEQVFGRIIYSGSHDKSIGLVLNNKIDAAFVSSSHLSTLVERGEVRLDQLKILWRSGLLPRDPFVFRGSLCRDIREKITSVFLSQENRQHEALLRNLQAVSFVPVTDSDYQIIRDISAHQKP